MYDGAIEGIRDGCTKSGDKCDFHRNFDNPALLINGWSDIPVERVHPPVPEYDGYNDGFNFHYCKPDEVKQGQFTEKHHLKKEKIQCDVEDRELNDYCPRVQLRKLFESCNLPKLSFEETIHKDGSKTYVPVDANGTKEKIFSQIDEFIKEYTGEDLRNTVMSDVNHYLSNAIEKDVRKRARQEKKSNVMSLTVDEIDWEEMVLSGKIGKMYVAQLDMYLIEKIGMSLKEIKTKGFTYDKKVALIRKHVLTSKSSNSTIKVDSKNLPQVASVPLSTPSSNVFNFSNTLNLIPWSGYINRHGNILELVNTCPLDNFLMVFDYLFYLRKTDIDLLPDPLPATFSEINKFLIDAEFGEAKMRWLETLRVVPPVVNGKVDVFGSENERFISGLSKLLANTVTSTCSEPNCPKATINVK